jgi:hypothetical protein
MNRTPWPSIFVVVLSLALSGPRVGAQQPSGADKPASAFNALTCTPTTVVVNGVTYYSCGGAWYTRGYQEGSVTYIVVNAPLGY